MRWFYLVAVVHATGVQSDAKLADLVRERQLVSVEQLEEATPTPPPRHLYADYYAPNPYIYYNDVSGPHDVIIDGNTLIHQNVLPAPHYRGVPPTSYSGLSPSSHMMAPVSMLSGQRITPHALPAAHPAYGMVSPYVGAPAHRMAPPSSSIIDPSDIEGSPGHLPPALIGMPNNMIHGSVPPHLQSPQSSTAGEGNFVDVSPQRMPPQVITEMDYPKALSPSQIVTQHISLAQTDMPDLDDSLVNDFLGAGDPQIISGSIKPSDESAPQPDLADGMPAAYLPNPNAPPPQPSVQSHRTSPDSPLNPPLPVDPSTPAAMYKRAMEKMEENAKKLGLPVWNSTLPDIKSMGNGGGINNLMHLLGQNLGSSMGTTAGNLVGGTTGLLANYADAMKEGFVSVFNPVQLGAALHAASPPTRQLNPQQRQLTIASHKPSLPNMSSGGDATGTRSSEAKLQPMYGSLWDHAFQPTYVSPFSFSALGPMSAAMNPLTSMNPAVSAAMQAMSMPMGMAYSPWGLPYSVGYPVMPSMMTPQSMYSFPSAASATPVDVTVPGPKSRTLPEVATTMGQSIGHSLGNSLASDLNLINGAAENFLGTFNTGLRGSSMPRKLQTVGLAPVSGFGGSNLPVSPPKLTPQMSNGLNQGSVQPLGTMGTPALGSIPSLMGPSPSPLQQGPTSSAAATLLLLQMQQQLEMIQRQIAEFNQVYNVLQQYSHLMPTPKPINDVWSDLNQTTQTMGGGALLPLNASLSDIAKQHNAAVGSAMGNAVGSTLSSIVGGGASLIQTTGAGFAQAISPLMEGMQGIMRKLEAVPSTLRTTASPLTPSPVGNGIEYSSETFSDPSYLLANMMEDQLKRIQQQTAAYQGMSKIYAQYQRILPTAVPLSQVWAEYNESARSVGAPLLPLNATLTEIAEHNNGAVGNVVGNTLGSLVTGGASLLKSTGSGFLTAMHPLTEGAANFIAAAKTSERSPLLKEPSSSLRGRILQVAQSPKNSCSQSDTFYMSRLSRGLDQVDSVLACQQICQMYSHPFIAAGCVNASEDQNSCRAVSYNEITGRCVLHFAPLIAEYSHAGWSSSDVLCSASQYLITSSTYSSIVSSPDLITCLGSWNKSAIQVVADASRPMINTPIAPELPALPAFVKADEPATSIDRYNPAIDANTGALRNKVFQSEDLSGAYIQVADWRSCAVLCAKEASCEAWTYIFDAKSYVANLGSCALATNEAPLIDLPSSVHSIAAPKLTTFPVDLFGSSVNQSFAEAWNLLGNNDNKTAASILQPSHHNMTSNSADVLPLLDPLNLLQNLQAAGIGSNPATRLLSDQDRCDDPGFAYYSLHVPDLSTTVAVIAPNSYSAMAATVAECVTACQRTSGCVAYQFVPLSFLRASPRLSQSQSTACLLLSQAHQAISAAPTITAGTLPRDASGLCRSDSKPVQKRVSLVRQNLESISQTSFSTTPPSQADANALHVTLHQVSSMNSSGECVSEGVQGSIPFFNGVSFAGRLVDDGSNVIPELENAKSCLDKCGEHKQCVAFSFGRWGGCYLLQNVENQVTDGSMISSYKDCSKNIQRRLQGPAELYSPYNNANSLPLNPLGRGSQVQNLPSSNSLGVNSPTEQSAKDNAGLPQATEDKNFFPGSLSRLSSVSSLPATHETLGYQPAKANSSAEGQAEASAMPEERNIVSCSRAQRGLIYTQGHVISNTTEKSSDECFWKCRATSGCYYLTSYTQKAEMHSITKDADIGEPLALGMSQHHTVHEGHTSALAPDPSATPPVANAPSSWWNSFLQGSERQLTESGVICLLFDRVTQMSSGAASLAISAESNCDVIGDLGENSRAF